jgi:hypothetical protein
MVMSNSEALRYLNEITIHIRWLSNRDPFVAKALEYFQSDLVKKEHQFVPRAKDEDDWYFDEWEEDYCYEEQCCGTSDCQEDCCNGCFWGPSQMYPSYITWRFNFDGDEYHLNTPQMILYRVETRELYRMTKINADSLLEAINMILIQEITKV